MNLLVIVISLVWCAGSMFIEWIIYCDILDIESQRQKEIQELKDLKQSIELLIGLREDFDARMKKGR